MKVKLTKNCVICNVEFVCRKSQIDIRKTCSMKCRGELLKVNQTGERHPRYKNGDSIKKEYSCQSCKTLFISEKGYKSRVPKFCSRKCAGKGIFIERPIKKCTQCEKEYEVKYLQGEHLFCSTKCAGENRGNKIKGIKRPDISGEKSGAWKGGITPINEAVRKSIEYKEWRKCVFEKDNYTCQECGQVGGKLQADHIKPFAYYPELRFDIDNGRTLCKSCHEKTDTYGSKAIKYAKPIN